MPGPRVLSKGAIWFAFRGRTLAIESAHDGFRRFAQTAFEPLHAAKPRIADHVAGMQIVDAALHVTFDGERIALAHSSDLMSDSSIAAYYATRAIFTQFAAADRTSWAAYGAAVRVGDRAVLLLGRSRIGKTLLTLHLLARGADVYGDETIVIDRRSGDVDGMPRRLMVREPALALLPNDMMREVCRSSPHAIVTPAGRLWYALDADVLSGGRTTAAQPAPIAAVAIINDARARASRVEPLHSKKAAIEFARRLYRPVDDVRDLSRLTACFDRVRACRLSLGSPADAAERLVDWVTS